MEKSNKSTGAEFAAFLKNNLKSYMMYIALVIIMVVFQIWSGGGNFMK